MIRKAYGTCITFELENNCLVKYKRFHLKKFVTRQTVSCPSYLPKPCFRVFDPENGKAFAKCELYRFCVKVSIKDKTAKPKKNIPLSLLLV